VCDDLLEAWIGLAMSKGMRVLAPGCAPGIVRGNNRNCDLDHLWLAMLTVSDRRADSFLAARWTRYPARFKLYTSNRCAALGACKARNWRGG